MNDGKQEQARPFKALPAALALTGRIAILRPFPNPLIFRERSLIT